MDPLKRHLRASSLLEAIVASVLFLMVFTLSLETLARLSPGEQGGEIQMAMDNALQACERAYMEQPHDNGMRILTYPWGTIHICREPYGETPQLQALTLSATHQKTHRRIQWRRILHHPQHPLTDEAQ